MKGKSMDKTFLALAALLAILGFAIFISASLGLLAREGVTFSRVASTQLIFGLIGGSIALFIAANTHYKFWRQHALWIFVGACVISVLVFIPGIGLELKGAHRWLSLGSFTFQPSEILKIGYIVYLATWLANARRHIDSWKHGLLPFLGISAVIALILLLQKDTDTLIISMAAGLAMFVASGAKIRDIGIVFLVALLSLSTVVIMRPYVLERIQTFLHPGADPLGASYQIQQSLIAVG